MLGMQQRAGETCPPEAQTGSIDRVARERSRALRLRSWRSLAISVCSVALGACGGEGGDGETTIAQDRGRLPDGALAPISASDAGTHVKITNVGEPCSLLAHACAGDGAQCMDISLSGAFYANGYCTADCKSSSECGPNAECPVGESELLEPDYDFRSTWARKCFKSCAPSDPNACRVGYAC